MTDSSSYKGIYVPAERWQTVRSDASFIEAMRLARIVNSLSMVYRPILVPFGDDSPRTRGDRFAAFMYAAALLKEGLHTAQGLGAHFRHLPQYKKGFQKLLGDETVQSFRERFLDPIRNKMVFHVDKDALASGFEHFPQEETLIATLPTTAKQGEIYFDAADDAFLGSFFGDAETKEEYNARLSEFMLGVVDIFKTFMRASHSLLPAALDELGCYSKPLDEPSDVARGDNVAEDQWKLAWYQSAHSDMRWAKEQGWRAVQWSVLLLVALSAAESQLPSLPTWMFSALAIVIGAVALYYVGDLHNFAKKSRHTSEGILNTVAGRETLLPKRSFDRHHIALLIVRILVVIGTVIFAVMVMSQSPEVAVPRGLLSN